MFALQKLAFWALQPSNLLFAMLLVATALLWRGRTRAGRGLLSVTTVLLAAIALLPLTELLAAPLENRYPPPPQSALARVDGIIVLGGALSPELSAARGQPALTDGGERMTEFVALARRYPQARLLFSGGSSRLDKSLPSEADIARELFAALGLDDRVLYEEASRDTFENARLSYQLAAPQPGESWLLITSALHLPRAVGAFARVGWQVTPYPVDYLTSGRYRVGLDAPLAAELSDFDRVVGEWLALIAFRLLGRTERLLP